MADGLTIIRNIGYILILFLVFSPLSFLVANTFAGDRIDNTCYDRFVPKSFDNQSESEQAAFDACQESYEAEREKRENIVFIVISVISLITVGLLLVFVKKIHPIISYSLFFGSGLNTIIILMQQVSNKSYLALGLGIVLFIILLAFINKTLAKKKK